MKQDKNVPMTNGTSHPPSEGRGAGDIDATTDYNMDDALLWAISVLMFLQLKHFMILPLSQ